MTLLFFTRLALYFLAVLIPIIHPAVVVPYDVSGWWLWFFLVPVEMGIACFLGPPRFSRKVQLCTALVFLVITALGVTGISSGFLTFLLAGGAAFFLTLLVFQGGEFGGLVSFVEPVFLGFVYYKLLSFSRSSGSISAESAGVTRLVFALIIVTYLVHGLVLYFSAFRGREKKRRRIEVLILGAAVVPLVFLFTIVLPGDFVDHSVVLNNLYPDKEPETIYDTDTAKGWEDRRNGITDPRKGSQGKGDDTENGREGVLQGIPSDQWGSFSSGQGGEEKQYAVMLVISPREPVYTADAYFPELDPVRGFLPAGDGALNALTTQRFIETWKNLDVPEGDAMRVPTDVAYISTLRERVVAYVPYAIEPTVLKPQFFPFEYFYNTTSLLSVSTLRDWKQAAPPSPGDFEGLERYLAVPLDEETRLVFQKHLDKALEGREGIGEKIEGILNSFTTYQYELGFNDDVSILKLRRFLDVTRSGDCSEFSNTTAILGRMAGIPTRVVTGYLASKDLQTPAHRQGVRKLRSMIEELAGYPEDQIYLVTTAHRHSWAQFYIPDFGWVDIESTSYGIPPPPGFDPNSRDVVIPLIRDNTGELNSFTFPWRFMLKVVLMGIGGVVVLLYLLRYGREVYLTMITKTYTPRAVRALYTLLLMKTASAGWPLKGPSKTPKEYAEEHPALTGFAEVYTQLRYRDRASDEEKERLYRRLKEEYRTILEQGKERSFVVRALSLKGLYY